VSLYGYCQRCGEKDEKKPLRDVLLRTHSEEDHGPPVVRKSCRMCYKCWLRVSYLFGSVPEEGVKDGSSEGADR
jgi:hypothetical protein